MNERCRRCNRRLKNKEQQEIGYGKICHRKILQKQQTSLLKDLRNPNDTSYLN